MTSSLFMTCSWHVHDMFMTCSWHIHDMFMTCSWQLHNIFMTCSMKYSWLVHHMFTTCSPHVHHMFTTCSPHVYHCSRQIPIYAPMDDDRYLRSCHGCTVTKAERIKRLHFWAGFLNNGRTYLDAEMIGKMSVPTCIQLRVGINYKILTASYPLRMLLVGKKNRELFLEYTLIISVVSIQIKIFFIHFLMIQI